MNPKYDVGQKVVVKPISEQASSSRSNDIDSYTGQVGEVSNYYWISPRTGQVFYIYHVRIGADFKELVLYEDEIEPYLT